MKKAAVIIGAILLLAFLLSPSLVWCGATTARIRFHATMAGSSHPVVGAKTQLVQDSQLLCVVTTDTNGFAKVCLVCGAGGSSGILGRTGRFRINHELLVEADGYHPISIALASLVGGSRQPLSKRVFDVELHLFRNP